MRGTLESGRGDASLSASSSGPSIITPLPPESGLGRGEVRTGCSVRDASSSAPWGSRATMLGLPNIIRARNTALHPRQRSSSLQTEMGVVGWCDGAG